MSFDLWFTIFVVTCMVIIIRRHLRIQKIRKEIIILAAFRLGQSSQQLERLFQEYAERRLKEQRQ